MQECESKTADTRPKVARETKKQQPIKPCMYDTRVLAVRFILIQKQIEVKIKYLESTPDLSEMEENTIYIALRYKTSSHLCLCGCKNEVVLPMGNNGWSYQFQPTNPYIMTFKPSILNQNCPNKYHYVITNNIANIL